MTHNGSCGDKSVRPFFVPSESAGSILGCAAPSSVGKRVGSSACPVLFVRKDDGFVAQDRLRFCAIFPFAERHHGDIVATGCGGGICFPHIINVLVVCKRRIITSLYSAAHDMMQA